MVDFCNNCGAIIMGKKNEETKCPSCGAIQKTKSTLSLKEKHEKKEKIEIIASNSESQIHPLAETTCPKCKHNRAYFWTKQMRAGDEPETQFYECEKCKHKWRNYS
jgi:DNA-directed RNA polymerase subunit M